MKSRHIPETIKRRLRQEACFGCAICGNPIIQYAHIIPFSISQRHDPCHMILLCPTDHVRADRDEYFRKTLYKYKAHPYNANQGFVKGSFRIEGEKLIINAGTNRFVNTPNILVVDQRRLVSLRKMNDLLFLDADFFNERNQILVSIKENEWHTNIESAWDIQYRPIHLKIYSAARNILLELKVVSGEVWFRADMFYNGFPISIKGDHMRVGENDFFLSDNSVENQEGGIAVDTKKSSISIGGAIN